MKKRFMLTAAGAAATGIAGSASAELVDMMHGLGRWAGEHSWQVTSSGGSTVAFFSSFVFEKSDSSTVRSSSM